MSSVGVSGVGATAAEAFVDVTNADIYILPSFFTQGTALLGLNTRLATAARDGVEGAPVRPEERGRADGDGRAFRLGFF